MKISKDLREIAEESEGADGYFAAMYYHVTRSVEAHLDASLDTTVIHRFNNPERMERFIELFYHRYILASPSTKCWKAAFDVEEDPCLLIVQHLLLGINAHINYDLCQTVLDVAGEFEVRPGALSTDYFYINYQLRESYAKIIERLDLASRWTSEVASLGGGRIFNFSLTKARDVAWSSALRLSASQNKPEFLAELDELVSVLAYLITQPPLLFRPALMLGRAFEEKDPSTVTRMLLGDE